MPPPASPEASPARSPGETPARYAIPFAAAAYLAIAVLYTWPVAGDLRHQILGYSGFENTDQTFWLYAEWKAYVVTAAHRLLAPHPLDIRQWGAFFWTVMSFSAKVSMANGLDFVFTWPLEAVLGTPAYYNVKGLLILGMNGLALYALLRGLGCRRFASWVGGAVFAFNPFSFYLLATGRIIESLLFPMPLYALCLWKAWHIDTPQTWKWAVGAGACFGLATLFFWFDAYFLLAYTVLFLLYYLIRGPRPRPRHLGMLGFVPLIALVLIMPAAMPYLVMLGRGDRIPGSARGDAETARENYVRQTRQFSCDLEYGWRPLIRSLDHQGNAPAPSQNDPPWMLPTIHTFDGVLFGAAIIGLFLLRREHRFWIAAFLLLYTLPLGATLKVDGQVAMLGGHDVRLPFYFMVRWLPLLDHLFFPAESMGIWTMAAAVVIGLGLGRLEARATLVLGTLLLITSGLHMHANRQIPLPSTPLTIPPPYTATHATDGFIYLPANLKFWDDQPSNNREFYVEPDLKHLDLSMALNHRKALWGRNQYLAGRDIWMFQPETALANSFLHWLLYIDRKDDSYTDVDFQQVRQSGFRYVVVMERFCWHEAWRGDYRLNAQGGVLFDTICARLQRKFGPPVYEGIESNWDKYHLPSTVERWPYRIRIFDMDLRPPAQRHHA